MSFYNSINLDFGCPIDRIDRISVFLYFKILLTAGPIWFSVAVIIPKGLEEVYNFLRGIIKKKYFFGDHDSPSIEAQ